MNIGYFIDSKWFPPTSGGSIHAYQLASGLTKRGHSLYSISCDDSAPFLTIYRKRHLLQFLKKIDIAYIRTDGLFGAERFTLLKILKLLSLPVVWEINAPLEELLTFGRDGRLLKSANRKRRVLARLVDGAICVSDELLEYSRQSLGIKRSYAVANGSDTELFHHNKRQEHIYNGYEKYFKVIWVGSAKYPWQGVDIVFEVAKRMRCTNKKVVFIVIADKKHLPSSCMNSGNVIVLDRKNYFDLPPYIASSDVGLCLYHNFGWNNRFYFSPLKLFDYMASGLSVIATDKGQISRVIQDGKNGILVKDNNVDEIIKKILFLMDNPRYAKALGAQARRQIEDYYNWERAACQTENILKDIAASGI